MNQKNENAYGLQYSQAVLNCPNILGFHGLDAAFSIRPLAEMLEDNQYDLVSNFRGGNKWQLLHIGSRQECRDELRKWVSVLEQKSMLEDAGAVGEIARDYLRRRLEAIAYEDE